MKALTNAMSIGFSKAAIAGSCALSSANSTNAAANRASQVRSSPRRARIQANVGSSVSLRHNHPQAVTPTATTATTSVARVNGTGVSMHTNQTSHATSSRPNALAAAQPRSSSGASACATTGHTARARTWTTRYQVIASRTVAPGVQSSAGTVDGPTGACDLVPRIRSSNE